MRKVEITGITREAYEARLGGPNRTTIYPLYSMTSPVSPFESSTRIDKCVNHLLSSFSDPEISRGLGLLKGHYRTFLYKQNIHPFLTCGLSLNQQVDCRVVKNKISSAFIFTNSLGLECKKLSVKFLTKIIQGPPKKTLVYFSNHFAKNTDAMKQKFSGINVTIFQSKRAKNLGNTFFCS